LRTGAVASGVDKIARTRANPSVREQEIDDRG
jgi:hypothetical protein